MPGFISALIYMANSNLNDHTEKKMNSSNYSILPGFDNVAAIQVNNSLWLTVNDAATVVVHRDDYDCDASFVYEVNQWAARNGGVKIA